MARVLTFKPDGSVRGGGPMPLRGVPERIVVTDNVARLFTPQIVPLRPLAAQILDIALGTQACTIKVYFKEIQVPLASPIPTDPPTFGKVTPCFLDLYVNGGLLLGGVMCLHRNAIVRERYLGFSGELSFIDMQGVSDPEIAGLGTRWLLAYFPRA
jgi:hypothetical protein